MQLLFVSIKKTRPFKYTENFIYKKWKFSDKNSNIFLISAQNIDCGYSLEPPRLYKSGVEGGQNYIGMFSWCLHNYKSRNVRKHIFGHVRQAKIQISLCIRAVWSESSMVAFWIATNRKFYHTDDEDSYQIAQRHYD